MASQIATVAHLGGLARSAMYDGRVVTSNARKAFADSFLDQVDPTGSLRLSDPVEAERRARAAKRLHYARLALKSAKVRSKKKIVAVTSAAIFEEASASGHPTPE